MRRLDRSPPHAVARALRRMVPVASCASVAVMMAAAGCTSSGTEDPAPSERASASSTTAQPAAPPGSEPATPQGEAAGDEFVDGPPPVGWATVDPSELTPEETERLTRGRAARDELGRRLMSALMGTMRAEGPAAAVATCHEAAPTIASEVAAEFSLAIGRTSHRVRNPQNAPPDWARALVDMRHESTTILRGPEGQIGEFAPVRLQGACLACHGPEAGIEPDVLAAIRARYPDDAAVGFNEGDVRGWFWFDVARDPS